MKKYISLCLALILIISNICSIELTFATEVKEFRAVWVSTVVNLDYPSSATTNSAVLKSEADSILEDIKDMGMTAVILQVRPASDSLYPSDLFPWSQYLTGVQGTAPKNNFDVLEYWTHKAHDLGLELHAWINPYRVAMNKTAYNSLADSHPAKDHPEWVVAHTDGRYYFDPGIPQVQQLVLDGAMEIVENYDIDGLHMDDYFYPDATFDDANTFAEYGAGFDNVGDWRRDNVNRLVKKLYDEIKSAKSNVAFGISPAGIWANKSSMALGSNTNGNETYFNHFADTRKWVKEGWLDYICPQIYWEIGHAKADYKTLANWWADTVKGSSVKLYIGMSDYQAGAASGAWKGIDEIKRQINLNATRPEIKGEAHFRYRFIRDNTQLVNYYKKLYTQQKPADKPTNKPTDKEPIITLTTPVHVTGLKTDEHIPYMQGDGDLFMPAKTMTRAEASVMLARLMTDEDGKLLFENYKGTSDFDDVPKNSWYASAVALMEETGIMKGFEDGEFKPLNNLTRGEFAAIASRFTDMQKLTSSGFADADKHWSKEYVANAVHYGFINGYDDGTFKPANSLTRSEAVAIMNRMLGRTADKEYIDKNVKNPYSDVSSGYWAYYYIMEASTKHHYGYADGEEFWSDKVVTPTPPKDEEDEEEFEPEEEEPKIDYNEIKYPFVADDFEFVRPDLRPNGELEPLDLSKVDTIAFHHMAHPTADFEAVLNGHHDNGWVTIGYNFWIGFDGRIYVGRGWNVPAAITSHNYHTINIGFQGDYETYNDEMPAAQLKAAKKLVKWLATTLDSLKYVGGHGDVGPTACPGTMFPYDEIIEDAEKYGLTDLRSLEKNPFKVEKEEPEEEEETEEIEE